MLRKSLDKKTEEDERVDEIRKTILRYSEDIPRIRKAVKRAGRAMNENLSRHIHSQRR